MCFSFYDIMSAVKNIHYGRNSSLHLIHFKAKMSISAYSTILLDEIKSIDNI